MIATLASREKSRKARDAVTAIYCVVLLCTLLSQGCCCIGMSKVPPPTSPDPLAVRYAPGNKLTLTWAGTANTTHYVVYGSADGKPWVALFPVQIPRTTAVVPGVPGSTFSFRIEAVGPGGATVGSVAQIRLPGGVPEPVNPPTAGLTAVQRQAIIAEVNAWTGTPYKFGGNNRAGIDCSHLVQQAYAMAIPDLPYRRAEQYLNDPRFGPAVMPAAGDLIVFPPTSKEAAHVGIITDVGGQRFTGAQSHGVAEAGFGPGSYWGRRPYQIRSPR